MSVFENLVSLNVNEHTEKRKNGKSELTYLSWPWAWAEVKKRYEDASYTIWKDENNRPYILDPNTGYMVYTSVTIEGITHEMWLPVMDGANKAMKDHPYEYTVANKNFQYASFDAKRNGYYDKYGNRQEEYITKTVEAATMMDINKTVMRCLVKNLAMFGLGLYIYAGSDLPENLSDDEPEVRNDNPPANNPPPVKKDAPADVKVQNKLPEAAPVNPVLNYLGNEKRFMAEKLGITDPKEMNIWFGKNRLALIKAKVVEDIPSAEMTMEDAKALCEAIYMNFLNGDEAK